MDYLDDSKAEVLMELSRSSCLQLELSNRTQKLKESGGKCMDGSDETAQDMACLLEGVRSSLEYSWPPHVEKTGVFYDFKRYLMILTLLFIHAVNEAIPPSSSLAFSFHQSVYQLVKIQTPDSDGYTFLHIACMQVVSVFGKVSRLIIDFNSGTGSPKDERKNLVKFLLKVGADPNAQDHHGCTPLHVVCEKNNINMPLVQALLEGGAHADMCDNNHVSPLDKLESIRSSGEKRALCPVANTTLKCLAARTIAHSDLLTPDLYKGKLGEDLENFIDMH